MLRKLVLVSAFAAGAVPFAAQATELSDSDWRILRPEFALPTSETDILLVQAGDVEIYYDGLGRRVIVDSWTGEVIAVEPPRRAERRVLRGERPRRGGPYYLDDPEDMERLRQDRLYELGRQPPPPTEDYSGYPEEYPEFRDVEPLYPDEALPEEPSNDFGAESEQPRFAEREPVERRPLGEPAPSQTPNGIIVEPTNPGSIEPLVTSPARMEVAELQVLLDRKGASPGVIDGHFGDNVDKALEAYRQLTGDLLKSTDAEGIRRALAESGGDAFIDYTITAADAAGPYVASVPEDYGAKAKLDRLSFTSVPEMLAERFHMDEKYLKALNRDANFNRPGTIIRVANVGAPVKAQVARIVADKSRKQVLAYDAGDKLAAVYPATIGSADTPSPSGAHTVARVVLNPDYTYNPKINFKQGENHNILKVPPGPNGPVGSVWIALSRPTYGIHGTPDPTKIGKTESHGCVRLTNWDAEELAKIVKPGVSVEFVD